MALKTNPGEFQRLRNLTDALPLTYEEKQGPVLNQLAAMHCVQVQEAFNTEGASTGKPWAPWSAAYAAWRRKRPGGILTLTHRLFADISFPAGAAFVRKFIPPHTYQFGFIDQIGSWHVTGTTTGMPARSMMTKTEADIKEFQHTFFEFWKARTLAIVRNAGKLSK